MTASEEDVGHNNTLKCAFVICRNVIIFYILPTLVIAHKIMHNDKKLLNI
jgi:amino acid permease